MGWHFSLDYGLPSPMWHSDMRGLTWEVREEEQDGFCLPLDSSSGSLRLLGTLGGDRQELGQPCAPW